MMTTYQPPPGAMMQHPGMAPGQPMAPGMGPSPTGPMGQPPTQGMPPGIPPGMGGPPGNQAMMGAGMHPAQGGPNAHAMSQLQPQGHMFPANRQMQQFAQNTPNMMIPQNNQAMLRQQQAMLQAQHLQQGMTPGAPGMHPAQQFQQMNGNIRVNFPSTLAAQQAQAQAQAQAQRGGMPHMGMQNPQAGTPGQPGHPGQAIQARQQPMPGAEPQTGNMQQVPTPTSQAQPPPGTPHPPQSQPNPSQQPTRPPSAASLPNQSGPPQQPQQQQQPRPQGPPGQQPNQGQPPGQQGGPPQNQQVGPAQGAQQQGPSMDQQAQQQRMMQLRQQQQQQQQAAQQQQQQQQQMPQAGVNPMLRQPGFQGGAQPMNGTLRLFLFADELSTGPPAHFNNPNVTPAQRLHYLKTIVMKNFSDNAVFHRMLWNSKEKALVRGPDNNPNNPRKFEISAPLLGRYFMSHFDSGLEKFQIVLGNAREHTLPALPPLLTGQYIDCQRSMIVEWYPKGTQVVHTGALKAIVNSSNGKIDWLEFMPTSVEAFISRGGINSLFPAIGDPPSALESPKMNKKTEKQQQQQHQQKLQDYERRKNERQIQFGSIPPLLAREDLFITDGVKRFYETAEIVSGMKDFVDFASKNPSMKPVEARDKFMEVVEENNKQLTAQWSNPQMMQGSNSGISTPSTMNGPQNPNMQAQFASPHNMGGSPHIGASPSQPQHMGHPMAANPSQQGTNSTAASANASPNIANKRRRSTVKNEGSEDGPSEVNGGNQAKVKQSPKPKRQKSTAG